jgi:very-short-patch-repair endonuclease
MADDGTEFMVGIRDALVQVLRCQQTVHALASIDSALHLGFIEAGDLTSIFAAAPGRVAHLRTQVDGRAESGQETMLRRIIADAGLQYDVQVLFESIGRVDFVVEGCLVVEADSRMAHDGWEKHVRDRGRDLALARVGYMSLRPAYQHTMANPGLVREAILNLVATRRPS